MAWESLRIFSGYRAGMIEGLDHFQCVVEPNIVNKNFRISIFILALALAISPIFAADDTTKEARFLTNTRQLIFEGRRSGEGYFSPDGSKLIFQSEREPGIPFTRSTR